MRTPILISAFLALISSPSWAETAHDATGYWLTENQNAIVQFKQCSGGAASPVKPQICGQIVWTQNPRDEQGKLKRDVNNPDEALRDRSLCGLPLIGDLTPASEAVLEDGWIYNPRSGDTYGAEAELVSADKLKLRGFLGISLLGSNQIWTRVGDDRGGC